MRKALVCPKCRKHQTPADAPTWPFCSERCKIADLGDWAAEKYKVPQTNQPTDSDSSFSSESESSDDDDSTN